VAKKEQETEFLVEDLIIEGILAGIFRTCDAVELTAFGEWLVKPFQEALDRDGYAERLVGRVFAQARGKQIPDTEFLRRFVEMAVDKSNEDSLLNVLNRDENRQKVTAALGAASVQFGVFLCLCGVYCKLKATKTGALSARDGKLTYAIL